MTILYVAMLILCVLYPLNLSSSLLQFSYQDKCFQYWPEKGCWMYGNVRVAMEDFTVLVDYTIRKFCVQYVSKSNSFFLKKTIKHSSSYRNSWTLCLIQHLKFD